MVSGNGQNQTEKKLSSKQARAIRHLLEKPTIQAAAASTQIARSTMYEWLSDADFKAALSAAESDKLTAVKARIVDESVAAVETLSRIHRDSNQPGSVRVRAARYVLDCMFRIQDQREILERIERLERRLSVD